MVDTDLPPLGRWLLSDGRIARADIAVQSLSVERAGDGTVHLIQRADCAVIWHVILDQSVADRLADQLRAPAPKPEAA